MSRFRSQLLGPLGLVLGLTAFPVLVVAAVVVLVLVISVAVLPGPAIPHGPIRQVRGIHDHYRTSAQHAVASAATQGRS